MMCVAWWFVSSLLAMGWLTDESPSLRSLSVGWYTWMQIRESVIISLKCWHRHPVSKIIPSPHLTDWAFCPAVWVGIDPVSVLVQCQRMQLIGTVLTHQSLAVQIGKRLKEITEPDTSIWNKFKSRVWAPGKFQKGWEQWGRSVGEGEWEKVKQHADGSLLGLNLGLRPVSTRHSPRQHHNYHHHYHWVWHCANCLCVFPYF